LFEQERPTKNPTQILENAYKKALSEIDKDKGESFLNSLNSKAREWIRIIATNSEDHKAVVTALTTSLTKKIETPDQDIRQHKVELPRGYSGRTLDTLYVTPFFKKHFRRIAMKEAGWLTRSIEQPHPFTLDFPGKIRNKQVKQAFLQILNDVEEAKADPNIYLESLFILLIKEIAGTQALIMREPVLPTKITIGKTIGLLKSHFFQKYKSAGAARLPVIAIYSLYETMMKELSRFQNKKLRLSGHISADVRAGGVGDIEVVDEKGEFFEAVEIKHNRPISEEMMWDAYEKFKNTPIKRYYLLTTAEPYVEQGEESNVKRATRQIRTEHGCEVIINGIVLSMKYCLRLVGNPEEFIRNYTDNLKKELSMGTEIKEEHVKAWLEILAVGKAALGDEK